MNALMLYQGYGVLKSATYGPLPDGVKPKIGKHGTLGTELRYEEEASKETS